MDQRQTLMQALDFTAADLDANRAGQLSEMQVYRLRVRRRRTELLGALLVLVSALLATAFIFTGNRNDSPVLLLVGIGVTICAAMFTGTFLRHWLRLNADINSGTVLVQSGKLERVLKPVNRRVINYLIRVDTAEIAVTKEAFTAFEHEAPYRLYRARYTGTLLAGEKL